MRLKMRPSVCYNETLNSEFETSDRIIISILSILKTILHAYYVIKTKKKVPYFYNKYSH